MPRQRQITMGTVTPEEAHEAAIRLNLKKRNPYQLVAKHSFQMTKHKEWMIVLNADDLAKPVVVMDEIGTAKKARKWLKLLSRAWAEGFYASGSTPNEETDNGQG